MMTRTAIDLFAGAGGATQGMRDAGISVIGAVEFDNVAAQTFRANHGDTVLWEVDIRKLPASEVVRTLGLRRGELSLLKACPPCQGFSSLAEGRIPGNDPRNELVRETLRFVRALLPRHVMIENVPGLGRDARAAAMKDSLRTMGYAVNDYVVDARDFGVPQRRRRYILLASRGRAQKLPTSLGSPSAARTTVRSAFDELSRLIDTDDELMTVPPTSEIVRQRIEAIPVGGSRFDLPPHLQLACHQRLKSPRDAGGVYGRMRWDEPGPTMTTRCTSPSSGPFLHPEYDRAITLREAAAIQTFPPDYRFHGSRARIERQIGNAVPVRMARQIVEALFAAENAVG